VPTIFVAVGTLPPSLVELPADVVALPTLRSIACVNIPAACSARVMQIPSSPSK